MAKRPTLSDITSLTNSSNINVINQNWDAIQEAFDNTVSRDGSTPNTMLADLDLNGNAILNVGTIDVDNLTLDGQQITDISSVPEWRSAWLTGTSYIKNDMVKEAGNVYICLESHTAGTFATDLTDLKWELMVAQSAAGAGTGDMLAANNLSDVVSAATSRANLGLGTVAVENTVPIAKGGTGATVAATALSNLGGQPAGATLTSLEALSLVQGDLLYATGADTLVRLAKGTAGQVLVMNTGATAPQWVTRNDRVLLDDQTFSGVPTVEFTDFDNSLYRYYEWEFETVKPAVDNVSLFARFSDDGGASYDSGASDYSYIVLGSTALGVDIKLDSTGSNGIIIAGNGIGNGASEEGVTGTLRMALAGESTVNTRVHGRFHFSNTTSWGSMVDGYGTRLSSIITDAIQFRPTSGNISGRIRMYGLT